MRRFVFLALLSIVVMSGSTAGRASDDARLRNAYRRPPQDNWTFVHLEGTPAQIGFQHGYLLAPEIADVQRMFALELTHDTHKDWAFFRDAAQTTSCGRTSSGNTARNCRGLPTGRRRTADRSISGTSWPSMPSSSGATTSRTTTSSTASSRRQASRRPSIAAPLSPPAATRKTAGRSSRTTTGAPISTARAGRIAFDIAPASGHRLLMDGMPGLIHSGDDFGMNDAGIVITETTISGFSGYDVNGIPEFVRARKAMQYGSSIDEVAKIFKEGNNGGYANDWLIADMQPERDRQPRARAEERHAGAEDRRLLRRLELSDQSEARGRRDELQRERHEQQRQRAAQALGTAHGGEQGTHRRRRSRSRSWPTTWTASPGRPSRANARCAGTSICRRADRARGCRRTAPRARCRTRSPTRRWRRR